MKKKKKKIGKMAPLPAPIKLATLVQPLIVYDQLELALMKSDRGNLMLGVSVDVPHSSSYLFACEVRPKPFEKYLAGRSDLLYVFRDALGGRYYFAAPLPSDACQFQLSTATDSQVADQEYWPSHGLFSRSHTHHYQGEPTRYSDEVVFKIDGTWGASDFARFNDKYSDLYGFLGALERYGSEDREGDFKNFGKMIQERFWQGGGSYGGFYDDLDQFPGLKPVEVARIQYASPGEIAFRGDPQIFDAIDQIVGVVREQNEELETKYDNIRGILRKEKLLKAKPDSRFSTHQIQETVYANTVSFGDSMKLSQINDVFRASAKNVLVFAKVILSVYRRAKALYEFQAEGRVQGSDY